MKVGVYVGSFNPVHNGHIKIVNYLINEKYVDKVIVVPTLGYWDKKIDTSLMDRINMLKFYENDRIVIDTKHNSLEYTYLILESLSNEIDGELFLIIGADNLVSFYKWKNVLKILSISKVLVINRDNLDVNRYISDKDKFIVSNFSEVNISSSEIRKFISLKKYDKIKDMMDERVVNYILENKLYER